jgi:hypothetical protein
MLRAPVQAPVQLNLADPVKILFCVLHGIDFCLTPTLKAAAGTSEALDFYRLAQQVGGMDPLRPSWWGVMV